MASTSRSAPFSNRPFTLIMEVSSRDDASNNRSFINYKLRVRSDSGFQTFSFTSSNSCSATVDGQSPGSPQFTTLDFRGDGAGTTKTILERDIIVNHNSNGAKTINFSGSASLSTFGSASVSGSLTLPTYNLLPDPPPNVTGLDATNETQTSIRLNWNSASRASGYRVYRNGTQIATTGSTNYTFSGLTADTSYTLGVRAYNDGGQSPSISTTTGTTLPNPPVAPANLTIDNRTDISLRLNWNASAGASAYYVYKDGVFLTSTTNTNYTFTGLSPITTYTLGVAAYNTGGASSVSTATGSTLPSTFIVPNVVGQTRTTAVTTLENAGFSAISTTFVTNGATASNNLKVLSQSPVAGSEVDEGSTGTINVYNYLISVPNVIGLTESVANTTFANAGFPKRSSSFTTTGSTVQNNLTVANQTPIAGTLFNPDNTVQFVIYNFLTPVPDVIGEIGKDAIQELVDLGFTDITVTIVEDGVTVENRNTVLSQSPVNSATTYNPKNTPVSLQVYAAGIVGRRFDGNDFLPIVAARRFDGNDWVELTVQKRFDGNDWVDMIN